MSNLIVVQDMSFHRKDVARICCSDGALSIELKDQELRLISEDEWYRIADYFSPALAGRIRRYFAECRMRRSPCHITLTIRLI